MQLNDRKWMPFSLALLMKNFHGTRLTKINRVKGETPLLTAGASNNGIADFIAPGKMPLHSHFISVDMFGHSFVHPYTATGDDNIYFFESKSLSDEVKHFISVCINMQSVKCSYGKQFRQANADSLKIMLPVNRCGKPDYAFMEAYIHECKKMLLARYKAFVCKNKITSARRLKRLSKVSWSAFRLLDYFDFKRGDQKDMNALSPGNEVLISARNVDNGFKGFYQGEKNHYRFPGNCLTLNNDGDGGVGLSYYQPHEFLLDTHVYALYPKSSLSKFAQLFISRSVSMCRPFFSHGRSISKDRLRTLKIMLPAKRNGSPDFEYMDAFGRLIMCYQLQRYLSYRFEK